MTPLFKKLNLKSQPTILVLNSPTSFETELLDISKFVDVSREESLLSEICFAVVFVLTQQEIEEYMERIVPKISGDIVLWFCYPKGSSKRYKCDFNRDKGWESLGKFNFEGVRQISIDEDWSALRFRKTEYIKILTRKESFALSTEGKTRTKTTNKT